MQPQDAVAVVSLARAAGRTQLLPVALHVCSLLDTKHALYGVTIREKVVNLTKRDQKACLDSRIQTQQLEARIIHETLFKEVLKGPGGHCHTPDTCRLAYQKLALAVGGAEKFCDGTGPECLSGWVLGVESDLSTKRCNECVQYLDRELNKRAEQRWNKLGKTYGIPDWSPAKNCQEALKRNE
ncbi:hypothetical protein BC835DRAFT_952621 [Cytidiella melzeri]|nr:hypothetical protein BC835DRAFT_952621 [Cytidiella melzeri]